MNDDMNDPSETNFDPVEINAPRGARVMKIRWGDDHTSVLPHRILRGFCPCALCQGHQGPIVFRDQAMPDEALELDEIAQVGNYALRLAWADQHNTGIYSFSFLRDLCCCDRCAEQHDPRQRAFSR